MRRFPALCLAAALSAFAHPAPADEPDSSFVRLHAVDLLEGALTREQTTKLQLLAHQAAIAAACDGFVLDDTKMKTAFEALAPVDAAKMTDAQKTYHDQHVLVIYGVLVGGELAAMADDVSKACARAAEFQADPEAAAEVVWR
jgi:hypothetical protein